MDKKLIINARKPEGELGSKMIERMNESHEKLAQWGVSHLNIEENDVILDIGCGGGINVRRFSQMSYNGKIYGLDYSELSVEKSKQLNELAINEGKVEIVQGSVSELPFDDETFDIVTGFETTYFWPNFTEDLKEVNRVLKDDGIMFICNEAVGNENVLEEMKEHIELLNMNIYSEEDFESALFDAGFNNVSIFRKDGKNWVCVIASKS